MFLDDLGITDDWTLENQPQERANLQLAMYATHLATGSTILCRTVKASTIRAYLATVAKFLGRFRAIDPRFVTSGDKKLAPAISMVIAEQERWETVPNRREPFTLELQATLAAFEDIADNPCGLHAAMSNWTMCNLYAGCRGIEWAQTNCTHRHLSTYHSNRFGNAYAFTCLEDVQLFTSSSQPVPVAAALADPITVAKIKLRFEEQKNGDNGEWKLFTRNPTHPHLCFVANFMQILRRHRTLTKSDPKLPLSVYRAPDGSPNHITTADVERVLRRAASICYGLDPVKNRAQLALWSSHSLRVGACTTLYSKGFSEMEIKYLLRWKSNAFMTYLRNLAVTSRRHNIAMNETSEIPNFV